MNRSERMALFEKVDLYPVTCSELALGRDNLEFLDEIIAGGTKIVQLREKNITKGAFYSLAKAFRKRCSEAGILLMINDHLDVALGVEADGVHLGQDDFPLNEARRMAPDLILGTSTHNRGEALKAVQDGADYYNIGPIYPTRTKEGASEFLGPQAVSTVSEGIHLPFTLMGGIKLDNLKPLLEQGARKIAVVTALTQAKNIEKATRDLIAAIRKGYKEGK